jgi:hypothetical protein
MMADTTTTVAPVPAQILKRILSKHKDSRYRLGQSPRRAKPKNPHAPAINL